MSFLLIFNLLKKFEPDEYDGDTHESAGPKSEDSVGVQTVSLETLSIQAGQDTDRGDEHGDVGQPVVPVPGILCVSGAGVPY